MVVCLHPELEENKDRVSRRANNSKANSGLSGQASSREADLTDNKLFVSGLLQVIDEKLLQQHFEKFGYITEVSIMKDRHG